MIAKQVDTGDSDVKEYEYRWGVRAQCEVRKAHLLKWVAKLYKRDTRDFKEQYEMIANSNEAESLQQQPEGQENQGEEEEEEEAEDEEEEMEQD